MYSEGEMAPSLNRAAIESCSKKASSVCGSAAEPELNLNPLLHCDCGALVVIFWDIHHFPLSMWTLLWTQKSWRPHDNNRNSNLVQIRKIHPYEKYECLVFIPLSTALCSSSKGPNHLYFLAGSRWMPKELQPLAADTRWWRLGNASSSLEVSMTTWGSADTTTMFTYST